MSILYLHTVQCQGRGTALVHWGLCYVLTSSQYTLLVFGMRFYVQTQLFTRKGYLIVFCQYSVTFLCFSFKEVFMLMRKNVNNDLPIQN